MNISILKEISMIYGDTPIIVCIPNCQDRVAADIDGVNDVRFCVLSAQKAYDYGTRWRNEYVKHILEETKSLSEETDVFSYEYIFVEYDEDVYNALKEQYPHPDLVYAVPKDENITEYLKSAVFW